MKHPASTAAAGDEVERTLRLAGDEIERDLARYRVWLFGGSLLANLATRDGGVHAARQDGGRVDGAPGARFAPRR